MAPAPEGRATLAARHAAIIALAAAVAAGTATAYSGYFIDDSYITFRYARNLREHGDIFFNDGEVVEGLTNIGWAAFLSFFENIPNAAKVASAVFCFLALALLGTSLVAGNSVRQPVLAVLALALLTASEFAFGYLANSGMEIAVVAFLLAATAAVARWRPTSPLLAVLCAGAFLCRPDTVLVLPLYAVLWLLFVRQDWRRVAGMLMLFAVLLASITAWRYLHFGVPLPNTFYAKPSSLHTFAINAIDIVAGSSFNLPYYFSSVFGILVFLAVSCIVLAMLRSSFALMLYATYLAGLLFAAYVDPDWTQQPRYFAPYFPSSVLLAVVCLMRIAALIPSVAVPVVIGPFDRCLVLRAGHVLALLLVAVLFANVGQSLRHLDNADSYPGFVLFSSNLVGPSEWVRDNTPADSIIATRRIGVIGYVSNRPIFDYKFGLIHRDVARLVRATGARDNDPSAERLRALWRERAPDYILEQGNVFADLGETRLGQTVDVHGFRYTLVRSFPIGDGVAWILAQRVDVEN